MRYLEYLDNIRSEGYSEERTSPHHITLVCLGGSDSSDNLVYLTKEEHVYAHYLLAIENEGNIKIIEALNGIVNRFTHLVETPEYIRQYARDQFSKYHRDVSGINNPMYGKGYLQEGEKNHMYGKRGKLSPNYGQKRSEEVLNKYFRGENNPMYGRRGENNPNYGKKLGPYPKREYHLNCKKCYSEFIGTAANQKYCELCRD